MADILFKPKRSFRDFFYDGKMNQEELLLEIANFVYHGYDLKKEIGRFIKKTGTVNYSKICSAFCNYIEIIRGGAFAPEGNINKVSVNDVYELVDLLIIEIRNLYRFPREGEPYFASVSQYYENKLRCCHSKEERYKKLIEPTPIEFIPLKEKEILDINPWYYSFGSHICPYSKPASEFANSLYDENAKWVLKCDEEYINKHNNRHKEEYKFRLQVWPKPFVGNPLYANVVILSLNPKYDDRTKRMIAKLLGKSLQEGVATQLKQQLNFEVNELFCRDNGSTTLPVTYREAQAMVDGWYWFDILEKFADYSGIKKEEGYRDFLYKKIAIIEYVGYASQKFKDTGKFPSQQFTRLLIQYLAYKKDTTFVVLRSKDRWMNLLGEEIWKKLKDEKRLIEGESFRRQSITPKGIKDGGFESLVDILKPH